VIAPRLLLATLAAGATVLAAGPATPALAAPVRVAALTPFTANTLSSVGVRPVAVGQQLGGRDRISSRLRGVPVLPLSHPNGPNLEQLARVNPRLVLSAPIWAKGAPGMRRLGIRVVDSDPRTVADVPKETVRIGGLVGRRAQATRVAQRQIADIRAASRGVRRHPSVLVVLGVGRTSYAFLTNSWGGDVVRWAGGRLITGGLRASGGYARISDEFVVAKDPDVIIAVPHGNATSIPKLATYLARKPGWRTTKAARHKRIHISTGNSLLQAFTDPGRTIRDVRRKFLKN
jgi:iron complex transport system substrate-binding protein